MLNPCSENNMRKLGVIADDFTGATDIAGFLVANGVATVQVNGVPLAGLKEDADAFVISLKSRSCPKDEAVRDSLAALKWLREKGCTQIYFKYCSTFDSTAEGNIGPVTDALMVALGTEQTIVCPALPVNGRTVYKGYLFVHGDLLHESGMRNHPVTPMTDSNISRIMESQSAGRAENLCLDVLEKGADAVRDFLAESVKKGFRYVVMDALSQEHLDVIAQAVSDMPLVTGGSGLAAGLARIDPFYAGKAEKASSSGRPKAAKTIIFSGSCSEATNRQVNEYKKKAESLKVDVSRCLNDPEYPREVLQWLSQRLGSFPAPLLYATASSTELAETQQKYNKKESGEAVESFFGSMARTLADSGVRNFIVAGGETSGKIVQSLGISAFHIGPQIDPGVPWVKAVEQGYYLALKSGNFGSDDFFLKAQKEII